MWGLGQQNRMWHQLLFKETLMQLYGPLCSWQRFLAQKASCVYSGSLWCLYRSGYFSLSASHMKNWECAIQTRKLKYLWLSSFPLLSSPFHIRAIFNNSQRGRLNLFWFTHGIVNWFTNIWLSNYWEHEYSRIEIFMAISWAFGISLTFSFLVVPEISP